MTTVNMTGIRIRTHSKDKIRYCSSAERESGDFILNGGFTYAFVLGSITEWIQTNVIASQKEGLLQGYNPHICKPICVLFSDAFISAV